MRISKLLGERLKETPAGITIKSHAYLIRAGYIKQVSNGIYTLLPPAQKINQNSTIPMDCHLMTKKPLLFAKEYIGAGVNIITAQIEAFETDRQIDEFITYAKNHNTLVGLSVEPNTDVRRILPYLDKLDIVLIMSVKTGKSGQEFNEIVLSKIEYLARLKANYNYTYKIEVDGGITDKTAVLVKQAGADIVVSGNYVYQSQNCKDSIEKLK